MGFKFRKSVKIAPGVRVNLGKKSASVSIGGKGFRKTYSTSGRKSTTVSIPGTGLSYTTSSKSKNSTASRSKKTTSSSTRRTSYTENTSVVQSNAYESAMPQYLDDKYKARSIGFFVISVPLLMLSFIALVNPFGFIFVAIGLFCLVMGFVYKKLALKAKLEEEPKRIAYQAELLEWQNAICEDKSEKLHMSVMQLEAATKQALSDDIRIFDECSNILNKTANPSIFFPRLILAEEKLVHLCSLEKYFEKINSIRMEQKPSELYNLFLENKERYVCDFIYKYYWTVKDKAETLKTEKGKQNQYQKFYDSLQPYSDQISEQNKGYIEAMYQQKI